MNFHDIRMPEFIETFAVGKPEFAISCAMTLSGREVRNLDREYARVCRHEILAHISNPLRQRPAMYDFVFLAYLVAIPYTCSKTA